uniref:HOOK domain-containing protein n=1 Tax=Elaeophora elaphi TaxID=1147741 RepID=A0A0R3S6D6_9BILA
MSNNKSENQCLEEKNEKYRELKLKEMQIDEFLNSYDSLRVEEESRIDEKSAEVVRILELISTNVTNLYLVSQNTNFDLTGLKSDENISASTLKELYVRLQEKLLEMDELEKNLKMDNNQIRERAKEINEKMEQFGNIEDMKARKEQTRQELENRRKILEKELPEANNSYQKLMDELEQTKFRLEKSNEYIKLKNIEKKWQSVEKSLYALREAAAQREVETNYEALRLKAAYNEVLIASLKLR